MRYLQIALLSTLLTLTAVAETPLLLPTPQSDPTEFGSLVLDPSDALSLDNGQWSFAISESYFNQWAGSWHTARVHRDRGLERQPITDDELRYLEQAFPDDAIFRVDVEGLRTDLFIARGLPRGMTLSIRVPYISVGSPNWDSVAEEFHKILPENPAYGRDVFPRGQTLVYIKGESGIVQRGDDLRESGIGDTVVSLGIRAGDRWGAQHRLGFSVKAPTGDEDSIRGSGGVDVGARWFAIWDRPRRDYVLGAGYNYLDDGGTIFGLERDDVWNVIGGVSQPVSRRLAATARLRIDSSPLASESDSDLGKPTFYYRLGLAADLGEQRWLSFEIGDELIPQVGIDSDWSFHVEFGTRFGSIR